MDLVASKAAEKNLDLLCKIDDDVPENLMGDFTRLRQVLVNLLSNAVKFTDEGRVSVTVTRKRKPIAMRYASQSEILALAFVLIGWAASFNPSARSICPRPANMEGRVSVLQ